MIRDEELLAPALEAILSERPGRGAGPAVPEDLAAEVRAARGRPSAPSPPAAAAPAGPGEWSWAAYAATLDPATLGVIAS